MSEINLEVVSEHGERQMRRVRAVTFLVEPNTNKIKVIGLDAEAGSFVLRMDATAPLVLGARAEHEIGDRVLSGMSRRTRLSLLRDTIASLDRRQVNMSLWGGKLVDASEVRDDRFVVLLNREESQYIRAGSIRDDVAPMFACDTVACIAGWAVSLFDPHYRSDVSFVDLPTRAGEILLISNAEAQYAFYGSWSGMDRSLLTMDHVLSYLDAAIHENTMFVHSSSGLGPWSVDEAHQRRDGGRRS